MADTENRGFLLQEDFAKALRLIGHYQATPGRTLDSDLALTRTLLTLLHFYELDINPVENSCSFTQI
jgi:hypothetical protein